jgi:hydroxymethylglutaryl-CoA reductase
MKQQQAETAAALEKEYGSRYKEHMEFLTRGLAAAGQNVARLIADAGLSGEMEIIKAFIAYGKMTAESGANRGSEAGASLQSVFDGGTFDYKE